MRSVAIRSSFGSVYSGMGHDDWSDGVYMGELYYFKGQSSSPAIRVDNNQ